MAAKMRSTRTPEKKGRPPFDAVFPGSSPNPEAKRTSHHIQSTPSIELRPREVSSLLAFLDKWVN